MNSTFYAVLPRLRLPVHHLATLMGVAIVVALTTWLPPSLAHAAPPVAGNIEAGKALFQVRCAECHAVGPMATAGFGPQLNGVIGRRAGSTTGFEYSTGMKQSGIVWDEKTLAAFIASPSKIVPGTKMRFWGIGNERKVSDLIAYLSTFKPLKD